MTDLEKQVWHVLNKYNVCTEVFSLKDEESVYTIKFQGKHIVQELIAAMDYPLPVYSSQILKIMGDYGITMPPRVLGKEMRDVEQMVSDIIGLFNPKQNTKPVWCEHIQWELMFPEAGDSMGWKFRFDDHNKNIKISNLIDSHVLFCAVCGVPRPSDG